MYLALVTAAKPPFKLSYRQIRLHPMAARRFPGQNRHAPHSESSFRGNKCQHEMGREGQPAPVLGPENYWG